MNYSEEQLIIIEACKKRNNVIIDAVAGSGKTTTLLGIATACPERILAVLFNRSLKEETRARAAQRGLSLLEVHNYHALARKYYDETICNDSGITKLLNVNTKPIRALPKWERIILDEVQDMSPLYFRLIKKLIHDLNNPTLRITCMGDRYQSIYAFLQADSRFLTHADQLYTMIKGDWVRASLSTTYRCSSAICSFINESLIGYTRLKPVKPAKSFPVTYIYGSPFDAHRYLFARIQQFIYEGYKPEDIFILAPSVKVKLKDTPVKLLENALVNDEIPVYVPSEDEVDISKGADGNPTQGKVVITTFHQSKGLEREIVIVYNFDDSYYKIFNREADPNVLSSELYVAMTRCKKHLFLLHDNKQPMLRYFRDPSDEFVRFINSRGADLEEIPYMAHTDSATEQSRIFKASEITNYLTAEAILHARSYLTIRLESDAYTKIQLPTMIETAPKQFEIVSDLNGIAIPAIYEWRHRKQIRIANEDETGSKFAKRYADLRATIVPTQEPKIVDVLEIANIFSAMYSGYHYKVMQIKKYNWTSNAQIEPCMEILEANLDTTDVQYEVTLPEIVTGVFTIMGRIDAYSQQKDTLWEIKCTDALDPAHEIQLGVYAWMFSRNFQSKFEQTEFHLLNIRSGECRSVHATRENLDAMIAFLIAEKTRVPVKKTDEEFIREFAAKFEESQPRLKQLTIPGMITTSQQALFIDDEPTPMKIKANAIVEDMAPAPTPSQQGRIIVFDLETNGLPSTPSFGTYYPPSELDKYKTSRIVQWSWAVYEPDGTLVAEEDHIIKPNFAEYRIMNQQFHGITESQARVQGKEFSDVLAIWLSHLDQATTIVGHNVNFDKHVLLSELHRRNHPAAADTTIAKHWICTMERAKELCALRAGNKLKPPKLKELMHALNVQEEAGRAFHNSKHDVYYTAKCFFAEQVLKNPCPKMYEGKYAGKTYEEILQVDRDYAVNALAVCNVRKLYSSPLRKLANWMKPIAAKDTTLTELVKAKEDEVRAMTN